MQIKKVSKIVLLVFSVSIIIGACNGESPIKKIRSINYKKIFERSKKNNATLNSDTTNIFDAENFEPSQDSAGVILDVVQKALELDSVIISKVDVKDSAVLNAPITESTMDSMSISTSIKDTFTNAIADITQEEIKTLKYNLEQLKQPRKDVPDSIKNKRRIEQRVWADISKKEQLMRLYIDGALVDSFKVSTGDVKHETPAFDMRPNGPIFNKYTSKKYPGGNYNGLGNMPYVVFVKGGYAIHGTTKGNIPKLGKKASHGCVRLHPDNAKIFNEIVRTAGLENTWVTIRN